ncbi:uncharacterized protein [Diadema antillarum]|uniref:uncharacterized protein n=1 Tax=Diadema antillarum TaxID=105358 RepID=UPI003A8A4D00
MSIQNCVDDFRSWLSGCSPSFTSKEKDSLWGDFLGCLPKCPPKAEGKMEQARIVYQIGLKKFQQTDYQTCLGYMTRCTNLLKEAETLCERKTYTFLTDIEALRLDVRHHRELAESCIAKAAEFRKRREAEQRQAREKERCKANLRHDLRVLEELEAFSILFGPRFFLASLFEKWPPKCSLGEPRRDLPVSGSLRKDIIRAISYYHPDKVDKEAHGSAWYFFSCEVTKSLSRMLDIVKRLQSSPRM